MAQFQNAFLFLTSKIYTNKNIFDENISLKKTPMVVGKIAPPPLVQTPQQINNLQA